MCNPIKQCYTGVEEFTSCDGTNYEVPNHKFEELKPPVNQEGASQNAFCQSSCNI